MTNLIPELGIVSSVTLGGFYLAESSVSMWTSALDESTPKLGQSN